MRRAFVFLLIGCCVAGSSYAQAPAYSFQGNWALDTTRSTMMPGEPPPKSSVMHVGVDDGKSFAWSQTTVAPDGKSSNVSFRGAFDGRAYPMAGEPGTTLKFTRPSPTSFHDDGSDPSGAHWSETCTLGADQKSLTCDGSEFDPKGGSNKYTDVWTKS